MNLIEQIGLAVRACRLLFRASDRFNTMDFGHEIEEDRGAGAGTASKSIARS